MKKLISYLMVAIVLIVCLLFSQISTGAISAGDSSRIGLDVVSKVVTGKGINVAVFDFGFDVYDSAISKNIKGVYSIKNDSHKLEDMNSATHGTNCAKRILEIAPDANLYLVSLKDCYSVDSFKKAFSYAYYLGCNVISISIWYYLSDFGLSQDNDSIRDYIDFVSSSSWSNTLVCSSAGNLKEEEYHYPSSYENTMSVAACSYDATKKKYVAKNGTHNDRIDISIPAGSTSAAAAQMAGVAALMYQAKSGLKSSDCKKALTSTALDIHTKGYDTWSGYGLVQPLKALEKLTGKSYSASPTVSSKKSQKITGCKSSYQTTLGSCIYLKGKAKTTLSYKSSNSKIAKINSKGKVTIKGIGKAVITVKASANKNYKAATKKITVNAKMTPVKKKTVASIKLSDSAVYIYWSKVNKATGYSINVIYQGQKAGKLIKYNGVYLSGIKKGEEYVLKIRAYKTINKKNYYSKWISKKIIL